MGNEMMDIEQLATYLHRDVRDVSKLASRGHLPGQKVAGQWRFLHEDYLQIEIEWGWLGGLLWAILFFGGIFSALFVLRKSNVRDWKWRRRLILPLAIMALAGVAVHAAVDFPFQIESIQLYVATYLGLCWGAAQWRAQELGARR